MSNIVFNPFTGTLDYVGSGGGGGSPGGSNTNVQYNNAGNFGGNANFTYDGTDVTVENRLSVNGDINVDFINDSTGALRADLANFLLKDNDGNHTVDWNSDLLSDSENTLSIDWNNRYLADDSGNTSINYSSRALIDSASSIQLGWDPNGVGLPQLSSHGALTLNSSQYIQSIAPGTAGNVLISNGTDWISSTVGGGSGLTVGTFGSSPNSGGASISGKTLTLQPASSTQPGGITTSTQSFGGGKTVVGNADEIQLVVKGNGTQTGNVLEVQNSAGAVQVGISKTGSIRASEIFAFGQGDITLTNCRMYNNLGTYTIDWQNAQLRDASVAQLSWSSSGVNLPQLTASKALALDGSKNITTYNYVPASAGDIGETSFSLSNNQAVAANVTGFAFANGTVRSFQALVSVYINATSSLFESFTLQGIQRGSDWQMSATAVGDTSGVTFSITTAGQVQYTSGNYTGFSAGTVKFRAITTSV